MAKLNVRGNEMMDDLARDLDIPFKRNGSMVVCIHKEELDGLKTLYDRGVKNGVKGLKILSREEALEMEPNLSENVEGALFAPTGGIICPFELTIAMAENANVNGVDFRFNTRVEDIRKGEDGFWHLRTNNGEYVSKYVVNAAGVYADKIHNMVSADKMHIIERRGDYCLLDKQVGGYVSHTIFPQPTKYGKGSRILLNIDRYANAFNDGPTGAGWQKDVTRMTKDVFERKYEIDSLCYPVRLAYWYWLVTGDATIFGDIWLQAVDNIVKTFREQQRKDGHGPYRFFRMTDRTYDTVGWNGYGAPVKPVGLIASVFCPSDDRTSLPFLVPSNFMAVSSLKKMAEILTKVNAKTEKAAECQALASEVVTALKQYAVVDHPKYGKIYAYEVDGFGSRILL